MKNVERLVKVKIYYLLYIRRIYFPVPTNHFKNSAYNIGKIHNNYLIIYC